MEKRQLGEMERRFARLIWEKEPVASGELVKLCQEAFRWKKSTTYTMLKRLCDAGLFQNQRGVVSSLLKEEDFSAAQGEALIQESFGGSLPRFLAAFTRRNKLSPQDIAQLEALIRQCQEE